MKSARLLAIVAAAFMVAGCANLGLPDLPDLGDILGSSGPNDRSDVRGYVVRVDTANQRIDLDVDMVNNLRESRPGSTIYYDRNTTVEYRGQQYRPEDLERGDYIGVEGSNVDGRYLARRITVLQNVRG
jgi:hypothetical protein